MKGKSPKILYRSPKAIKIDRRVLQEIDIFWAKNPIEKREIDDLRNKFGFKKISNKLTGKEIHDYVYSELDRVLGTPPNLKVKELSALTNKMHDILMRLKLKNGNYEHWVTYCITSNDEYLAQCIFPSFQITWKKWPNPPKSADQIKIIPPHYLRLERKAGQDLILRLKEIYEEYFDQLTPRYKKNLTRDLKNFKKKKNHSYLEVFDESDGSIYPEAIKKSIQRTRKRLNK